MFAFFRPLSAQCLRRCNIVFQHLRGMANNASSEEVILERFGSKGLITLNRPKALNALNLNMVRLITPQLKTWNEDPSTSMVIIRSVGEKAFCAGGDIRAITENKALGEKFFKEEYILNNLIGTLSVPWIALIDGITMGGGVGLSVHGKYRVATERTTFAMPETAIGLIPDVGGGYFLPRLTGQLGVFLALTGFRLKGRDVQQAGIATHFIESSKLNDLVSDLLALDDGASPQDVAKILDTYHDKCEIDKEKEFCLAKDLEKINANFRGETVEEIFANLGNDGSEWAQKQLDTLRRMSPTSMKLTLKQLRLGATMSLQEVLKMEYRITCQCLVDKDFTEGVRAVIVDKDMEPHWDPPTIIRVTPDVLKPYFLPLPDGKDLKL